MRKYTLKKMGGMVVTIKTLAEEDSLKNFLAFDVDIIKNIEVEN